MGCSAVVPVVPVDLKRAADLCAVHGPNQFANTIYHPKANQGVTTVG